MCGYHHRLRHTKRTLSQRGKIVRQFIPRLQKWRIATDINWRQWEGNCKINQMNLRDTRRHWPTLKLYCSNSSSRCLHSCSRKKRSYMQRTTKTTIYKYETVHVMFGRLNYSFSLVISQSSMMPLTSYRCIIM